MDILNYSRFSQARYPYFITGARPHDKIWTRQSLSSVLDKQEPNRLARKLGNLLLFYQSLSLDDQNLERFQRPSNHQFNPFCRSNDFQTKSKIWVNPNP